MKRYLFFTLVCVILMFVTPFTVVSQENLVTKTFKVESNMQELVNQLQVLINKILQKYGQIPLVKNLCNIILGALETIAFFLFCFIFGLFVALPLAILMLLLFFLGITDSYLGQAIFFALFSIFFIWDYNCNFITIPVSYPLNLSLNPLPYLLEKKGIFEINNDCSCLKE